MSCNNVKCGLGGSAKPATVHKWVKTGEGALETFERCDGHCKATCQRDKATGVMNAFDSNIPLQPMPEWLGGVQ